MESRKPTERLRELTLYELETQDYTGQAVMGAGFLPASRQGIVAGSTSNQLLGVQEQIVDLTLLRKGTGKLGFRFQHI